MKWLKGPVSRGRKYDERIVRVFSGICVSFAIMFAKFDTLNLSRLPDIAAWRV